MFELAWSRLTYFGSSSGTKLVCRVMGPGVGRGVGCGFTVWTAAGVDTGGGVGVGVGDGGARVAVGAGVALAAVGDATTGADGDGSGVGCSVGSGVGVEAVAGPDGEIDVAGASWSVGFIAVPETVKLMVTALPLKVFNPAITFATPASSLTD